jgi:hypothetical protein
MCLLHFGLHAAPNGAGMCGVMPSYKHIAPPEQRPGVTDRLFVQSHSKHQILPSKGALHAQLDLRVE